MTARTPDQDAILAAASFDAMPPLPRGVADGPATRSSSWSTSTISSISDAASLHRALQPAVDYAAGRGALVVVAAGNTDPGATPGPSLYLGMNNVLIVGATGPQDEVASYSDTGSGPTFIWAPGGDGTCSSGDTSNCIVIASRGGGYQVSEGTSFAVPHVAGVAALLMATGSSNKSLGTSW